MKILLYSDLHISKTSSILPQHSSDSRYTYRQQMIIDTAVILKRVIDTHKPDLIVNLGDTFDQNTITSYDVEVASQFFSYFPDHIPHMVLVGNHEMVNSDFNAVALLNNIKNITVVSEPYSVDYMGVKLAFLPYCDYNYLLQFPEGDILFSHNDIQGSVIRGDFKLPEGIDVKTLKQLYKIVFNGHIHKPSTFDNVVNVGSITTHSFSDDNDFVPQCYIFNTDTMSMENTIISTACPLFRKLEVISVEQLNTLLKQLVSQQYFKYVLQVTCPYALKEEIKDILDNTDFVVSYRISVKIDKETSTVDIPSINTVNNLDIKHSFKCFLQTIDLKYPLDVYESILEEVKSV